MSAKTTIKTSEALKIDGLDSSGTLYTRFSGSVTETTFYSSGSALVQKFLGRSNSIVGPPELFCQAQSRPAEMGGGRRRTRGGGDVKRRRGEVSGVLVSPSSSAASSSCTLARAPPHLRRAAARPQMLRRRHRLPRATASPTRTSGLPSVTSSAPPAGSCASSLAMLARGRALLTLPPRVRLRRGRRLHRLLAR
jgi:hypothetical protein